MPIYEYVCKDCGGHFDVIRSIKEADSPIQCKTCTSQNTSRRLSVFFAHSDGRVVASGGGCNCGGSCGGSCSSCGHHN